MAKAEAENEARNGGKAGSKWLGLAIWSSVVVAVGTLLTSYRYLEALASGDTLTLAEPLINELSAALGAGLLFWPLRELCLRYPIYQGRRLERLGLYALALLLFSILHTSWNWASRATLYPLAGLGHYNYGEMPTRYAMELGMDVVAFSVMVLFVHGWQRLEAARARELRAAQLESSLARAELQNLRLQLQPHFLFNALNTISATMYEDPAAADEMIGKLAELLRASLRASERASERAEAGAGQTDEVPLAEELDLLDAYLAILKARFGERLDVRLAIDADCRQVLVPTLFLQPLVENAIRHGRTERVGRGHVAIRAQKQGPSLELVVENDLPSEADQAPSAAPGLGLGLASCKERLKLLHGDQQSFKAGESGNLFRVEASLPFREAT